MKGSVRASGEEVDMLLVFHRITAKTKDFCKKACRHGLFFNKALGSIGLGPVCLHRIELMPTNK